MITIQAPVIRLDDRVVYQQNDDGTWSNLLTETIVPDFLMHVWFPEYFDECNCVLPEHTCSVCAAVARKVYTRIGERNERR